MAEQAKHRDLHAEITNQIVAAIEEGAPEFLMPWHQAGHDLTMPVNARTGRPYRGVNVLVLWTASIAKAFFTGYWATYRQWQELGAQVRKGERSSTIVFYKEIERETRDPESGETEPKRLLFARASRVFSADQVDGWQSPVDERLADLTGPIERADAFVAGTRAAVRHRGHRAYYDFVADTIVMPERARFTGTRTCSPTEAYYATLLHELTHWTAHARRLDRNLSHRFKAEAYAMEEFVAELGAAFLCAELAISNSPRVDHAAYINGWLKVLRSDTRAIFTAAGKASQAVAYLRGLAEGGAPPAEVLASAAVGVTPSIRPSPRKPSVL